jgi:phage/plasmid-associated DNA primase
MTEVKDRPKTLLIRGDQGSGKTTLARHIAQVAGRYVELSMLELTQPFGLSALADHGKPVATIIIDEFGGSLLESGVLEQLLESDMVSVNRKGLTPRKVSRPHVIVCVVPGVHCNKLQDSDDIQTLVVELKSVTL